MTNYNCVIVDDNKIDRLTVLSYVNKFPEFNVIGTYESAEEALFIIGSENVDILFLDIDMPSLNGLDFRKKVKNIPVCIFITSYPEFAVESFELDTLDFIIKPLNLERFTQTFKRICAFMEIKNKANQFEINTSDDSFFIKEGHDQTKINLKDVIYLEALKDYTILVTKQKRHCVLSNIGTLLKQPHFEIFVRIHRSYAVQKQFVEKIGKMDIVLNMEVSIPIGRSYKENLKLLV